MKNEHDLLEYLKNSHLKEHHFKCFQSKSMSIKLNAEFDIPKSRIVKWVQILKEEGLIKRVSQSGNCQTICSSCYEHGCEEGNKPPINFWKVIE